MKRFKTVRRVKHSPEAMFDLVADVDSYPQFVPLCSALNVRSRRQEGDKEIVTAIMHVSYAMFRESYTSKVVLDRENLAIDVDQISGPFRVLINRWRFIPEGEGTRVEFELEYEFKSRLMQATAGAVLDKAFGRFAEAFERRADRIYRRRA